MNPFESLKIALRGLTNNKMRSALTMLGIIIGVAVVIIVVAIGEGATERVKQIVNSLGTNLLTVFPGPSRIRITAASSAANTAAASSSSSRSGGGGSGGGGGNFSSRLTFEDAELIARNYPHTIEAVAPQVRDGVQVRFGSKDINTSLTGANIEFPYVRGVEVSKGRYFTEEEIEGSSKVCLIGPTVAEKLAGSSKADMTGQTIALNRQNFKVLGMLAPRGMTAWGNDQDDTVVVPITTAMRRILNRRTIGMLSIRCTSPRMMPLAQEQVSAFLRARHNIPPPYPDNDDFTIRSQTELMDTQQSTAQTMTSLLSMVAVVSLVVGGIGIMNIMLVSVTERTREIGIRKALGATPQDILLQFLIESAILSFIGGLLGIVVGIVGAHLLSTLAGWETIVNSTAVFAAVAVSVAVGLFFGIYPASKAAAMHPIEALRYE